MNVNYLRTLFFTQKEVARNLLCEWIAVTPFSPKTAHEIFLKLLMKLECLKGKKLTKVDFLEKI